MRRFPVRALQARGRKPCAQANQGTFTTVVLCPGMVLGPRDPKPTSTRLLHVLAHSRVAFLPGGGIPIVDARVLARAHRMALTAGRPGERYAIAGPYLSYAELAGLVAEIPADPDSSFPCRTCLSGR